MAKSGALLTPELLDALAAEIAKAGAPVDDLLAPGLPKDRIRELTAALGLELPDDAITLWSWRNGNALRSDGGVNQIGFYELYSLERAVERHELEQDVARGVLEAVDQSGIEDPIVAPREWFPFIHPFIAIDCGVPRGSASPVYWVDYHCPPWWNPVAGSIADVVEVWINALKDGIWIWNADFSRWEHPKGTDRIAVQKERGLFV